MDIKQTQDTLNQAKIITARSMVLEGFIAQEQFKKFVSNYVIVVRQAGWWDKLLEKVWGKPNETGNDAVRWEMVKVILTDDNAAGVLSLLDQPELIPVGERRIDLG